MCSVLTRQESWTLPISGFYIPFAFHLNQPVGASILPPWHRSNSLLLSSLCHHLDSGPRILVPQVLRCPSTIIYYLFCSQMDLPKVNLIRSLSCWKPPSSFSTPSGPCLELILKLLGPLFRSGSFLTTANLIRPSLWKGPMLSVFHMATCLTSHRCVM